jgi:hypothetical protein
MHYTASRQGNDHGRTGFGKNMEFDMTNSKIKQIQYRDINRKRLRIETEEMGYQRPYHSIRVQEDRSGGRMAAPFALTAAALLLAGLTLLQAAWLS